jgi:DNA polymerase III sliding clamp (beta) subunit (PCNA family)
MSQVATMNIKVDRDLLLSELYYLHGVAGAKQMIPNLSHLLIEAAPGKITMRATDPDVTITTRLDAKASRTVYKASER